MLSKLRFDVNSALISCNFNKQDDFDSQRGTPPPPTPAPEDNDMLYRLQPLQQRKGQRAGGIGDILEQLLSDLVHATQRLKGKVTKALRLSQRGQRSI